jgi:hypothetical protein
MTQYRNVQLTDVEIHEVRVALNLDLHRIREDLDCVEGISDPETRAILTRMAKDRRAVVSRAYLALDAAVYNQPNPE